MEAIHARPMMSPFFWAPEAAESTLVPSRLIPAHVVEKLQARRAVSSPTRKKTRREDDATNAQEEPAAAEEPKVCVPLTQLPEDVARQLFREDGWFEASDLMRLRVSKALRALVGPRPLLLFRHALPAFAAWRAARTPVKPRRVRCNSFQRSPTRRGRERAVLLF